MKRTTMLLLTLALFASIAMPASSKTFTFTTEHVSGEVPVEFVWLMQAEGGDWQEVARTEVNEAAIVVPEGITFWIRVYGVEADGTRGGDSVTSEPFRYDGPPVCGKPERK